MRAKNRGFKPKTRLLQRVMVGPVRPADPVQFSKPYRTQVIFSLNKIQVIFVGNKELGKILYRLDIT